VTHLGVYGDDTRVKVGGEKVVKAATGVCGLPHGSGGQTVARVSTCPDDVAPGKGISTCTGPIPLL